MCTPLGHVLAGYAVLSRTSVSTIPSRWMMLFFVVLVANLPDIDFLFGWSVGNPNRYHHLWTHSIVFAVLTGVVVGAVYTAVTHKNGFKIGVVAASIVGSHLVLPDRVPARGPRRRSSWCQCRRGAPRQDRPLAHGHGLLRAHGGAACARHPEGRRQLRRPLDHRFRIICNDRCFSK